jgi:NAD(P)-dependent dehydrogenase (short-subunit alcohol dehydrogenase family)
MKYEKLLPLVPCLNYLHAHTYARTFFRLVGKVAVITGGASGIGERTARLFVKHGASVVIADIQDELGASLCAELGPEVSSYVRCDVTSEEDVAGAVDHAVARFGKLDIMFNNAGIGGAPCHNIRENTKEDFERVLAVNLVGPFLGTKHAARVMVPARRGCIIGTSSLASTVGGVASHARMRRVATLRTGGS